MTALDIIYRARSVSNLPTSKFLSHQDELDSLNESWKDIYSALTEADDDYYVTETTFTVTMANLVAGTNNEYLFPLPVDFLKLRYLDFKLDATNYLPVKKFNLAMKDNQPGDPYYRIKGTNLWVIGGAVPATGLTLRMGYYPVTTAITAPQADFVYGTSYTGANFISILSPGYAPLNESAIYANGNVITAESISLATVNTPVALFTESGAPSNFIYWKGTLYWLRGGNMWYKATSLNAAFLTPTQVGAIANVVAFYITADTIYYANATQIRSCTLTGGSDALIATVTATSLMVAGPVVIYRTAASQVLAVAPAVTIYASSIAKVTGDGSGELMLWILDNAGLTRRVTLDPVTLAILTDVQVDDKVTDIGQPSVDPNQVPITTIIPTLKAGYQQLLGVDGTVNYNFSYPNNLVPEIMAWRSAIDYRVKQQEDPTLYLQKLGHPTNPSEGPAIGLWARFEATIKRDEYQPERIRNAYPNRSWYAR